MTKRLTHDVTVDAIEAQRIEAFAHLMNIVLKKAKRRHDRFGNELYKKLSKIVNCQLKGRIEFFMIVLNNSPKLLYAREVQQQLWAMVDLGCFTYYGGVNI